MNTRLLSIVIICLSIGFVSAYAIFNNGAHEAVESSPAATDIVDASDDSVVNSVNNQRIADLEAELSNVKQQLEQIKLTVNDLSRKITSVDDLSGTAESSFLASALTSNTKNRYATNYNQRVYNVDSLIKGGIAPGMAEDIVRRKNSIELRRLELQDRATREGYLNTQRYLDELEEINRSDISLREELGDQRYDEYLYNSKQNNRVRIASVMLGSPAEQAGLENNDVVLSYDNKRMFDWQELKDATAQGELGEYVSVSVYRDGEIYSFSVPRGTLGVQLGATRLAP